MARYLTSLSLSLACHCCRYLSRRRSRCRPRLDSQMASDYWDRHRLGKCMRISVEFWLTILWLRIPLHPSYSVLSQLRHESTFSIEAVVLGAGYILLVSWLDRSFVAWLLGRFVRSLLGLITCGTRGQCNFNVDDSCRLQWQRLLLLSVASNSVASNRYDILPLVQNSCPNDRKVAFQKSCHIQYDHVGSCRISAAIKLFFTFV